MNRHPCWSSKFKCIFSKHLDEFFMVRCFAESHRLEAGVTPSVTTGLTPQQQFSNPEDPQALLLEEQQVPLPPIPQKHFNSPTRRPAGRLRRLNKKQEKNDGSVFPDETSSRC